MILSTEPIHIENVHFRYAGRRGYTLGPLSLTLAQGESLILLGANGSGKSTLLSILAGVRRCRGARMRCGETDLLRDARERTRRIGYVPQTDPLLPDVSVRDNLFLWYQGSRRDFPAALAAPAVAILQLQDFLHKPVHALSGGMRRRVALAAALINDPQILLLDEPSSALDLAYKAEIRSYLRTFHAQGRTLLMSTHDEEDLDLADRLYLLRDGQLQVLDPMLRGDALLQAIRQE